MERTLQGFDFMMGWLSSNTGRGLSLTEKKIDLFFLFLEVLLREENEKNLGENGFLKEEKGNIDLQTANHPF